MVYRTQQNSDRELLRELLKLVKALGSRVEELTAEAEKTGEEKKGASA